ncbi:DUF6069 family protein [Amycolatopsis endophytica]|uniref:Uncharacterized protein n=1 Tax=Amycolatopsis endophytica TaxID=860233 RepID=A0A853B819_9PSEU|nr:DUF6069 family protein [Amycolatopsis endophytica]NYI91150.1 hypothetical protein [Amycolatopsis endophytica]
MTGYPPSDPTEPDYGRLWAGGVATAVVAALVAVVGLLISRGLFDVAVLAPKGNGIWGNANTVTYALCAAAAALLATGLMHLLSLATPAPNQFFGWIMVLITAIGIVLPLTLTVRWDGKIATALINLAIGAVIALLVNTVAATARRRRHERDTSTATMRYDSGPPYYS